MSTESGHPRAIIHLDLDACFAAVEVLQDRDLAGKPIIVGGRAEQRGVVSTASYAARAYGVRSAMSTVEALRLCPDAIVLPPRLGIYRGYSQRVMAILRETSPLVEQVSIDEAYLDVTSSISVWENAVELARQLQRRVSQETELSASLGVATNKLVAKVASDRDKPGGLTVVRPGEEATFLAPLPVRVLWGIGPKTANRLKSTLGVSTVGDLAKCSEKELVFFFGSQGLSMLWQAQGKDHRPLVTKRVRKSISQERTFARDIADEKALQDRLWHMSQIVAQHLQRVGLLASTIAVKLRYADFTTLTRQVTLPTPTDDDATIYDSALTLLERAWERERPLRLLGVAGRNLAPPSRQLSLWELLDEGEPAPGA